MTDLLHSACQTLALSLPHTDSRLAPTFAGSLSWGSAQEACGLQLPLSVLPVHPDAPYSGACVLLAPGNTVGTSGVMGE